MPIVPVTVPVAYNTMAVIASNVRIIRSAPPMFFFIDQFVYVVMY